MWFISYEFTDKSGNTTAVSSWLKPATTYTLGRDSHSTFVLDSNQVSKNHLRIYIEPYSNHEEPSSLHLEILGKQTTINVDEIINKRNLPPEEQEKPIHRVFHKSLTLGIGKRSYTVHIKRLLLLLKLTHGVPFNQEKLKSFDINYSFSTMKYTTHFIYSQKQNMNSSSLLDALIRQIPVVTTAFLSTILSREKLLTSNFESNFPNFRDFIAEGLASSTLRTTLFEDVLFVFGDLKQYERLGIILQGAGAKCVCFKFTKSTTQKQFSEFVASEKKSYKLVIVEIQSTVESFSEPVDEKYIGTMVYQNLLLMNEIAKEFEIYLTSPQDIITAVKNIDADVLFRARKPKTKISNEEAVSKKRQKVRKQVKALDSLDYFAGGNQLETQSQDKAITHIEKEPGNSNQGEAENKVKSLNRSRSRIQSLPNQMLETKFISNSTAISGSVEKSLADERLPDRGQVSEVQKNSNLTPNNDKHEQASLSPDHNVKPKAFSNAVIEAKRTAEERILEQFGTDETITEEMVSNMKNMAIIEVKQVSLRALNSKNKSLSNKSPWSPEWSTRKNFKVFVKNAKNKKPSINQSFLYTRQFVPLELYDPRKHDKMMKEDVKFLDGISEQKRIPSFQSNDDEAEQVVFSFRDNNIREPEITGSDSHRKDKSTNKLFVDSDDDFGELENQDLDMNVRVELDETIPEFKKFDDLNMRDSKLSAAACPVSKTLDRDNDADDDNDDDDEIPRFRFRS